MQLIARSAYARKTRGNSATSGLNGESLGVFLRDRPHFFESKLILYLFCLLVSQDRRRTSMSSPTDRFLTRRQLVGFLNEHGYPASLSTIAKLSMPSRREGPPSEGVW